MTVVVSVAAYFFVYNYPATAGFLTPEEREHVLSRLRSDNDASREEKFTWNGVRLALKDPKIYLYGICFHTICMPGYTLSLFLPIIINDLGYSATQAQLLSIPPHAIAFITTMAFAVHAEKTKRRAPYIILGSAVGIIGYIILIASHWPGVSYAGTIVVASGVYFAATIVLSWPANNVSGQTKRATGSAVQISIGNIGSMIGTQLYRPRSSPRFFIGHGMVRPLVAGPRSPFERCAQLLPQALGYLVGNIVVTGTLWYIMKRENERRDRGERDGRLKDVDEGAFLGDEDPRWRFQT